MTIHNNKVPIEYAVGKENCAAGNFSPHFKSENLPFSEPIISGLLVLMDCLIITISGLGIYLFHPGWHGSIQSIYLAAIFINMFITVAVFFSVNLYQVRPSIGIKTPARRMLFVYSIIFLALIAVTFALKSTEDFSRIWVFTWFITSAFLMAMARLSYCLLIHKWGKEGRVTRNVAIVGAEKQGVKLVQMLNKYEEPWVRIVGIYDDRISRVPDKIEEHLVIGSLESLIDSVRSMRIDDVLIALPGKAEQRTLDIIDKLRVLPVCVRLCPDLVGFNYLNHGYSFYGGVPLLNIFEKPIDGWAWVLKEIEDRVLGSIFFVLTLPVMLIIAVLIKLDSPGPVLFSQKRIGFNNKEIIILKFRTLYIDNQDQDGDKSVVRGDKRVTRLGTFLRRFSLDELPQIINVLIGEMSLVGPRPHAMKSKAGGKYFRHVVRCYTSRYRVKPGITGWAQVNGWRGETDTEEKIQRRVEYDLYYIDNWSIKFDLLIILKTIMLPFKKDENAY